jgi:hypothetical protein
MQKTGLSVSKRELLARLVCKNSLTPQEAQKLLSDISAQVTLSIATFELKRVSPFEAVAVIRGMHTQFSRIQDSAAILQEFKSKIAGTLPCKITQYRTRNYDITFSISLPKNKR